MFLVGIFDSVDINNTGKLFSPLKAWRLFSLRKCQVFKIKFQLSPGLFRRGLIEVGVGVISLNRLECQVDQV